MPMEIGWFSGDGEEGGDLLTRLLPSTTIDPARNGRRYHKPLTTEFGVEPSWGASKRRAMFTERFSLDGKIAIVTGAGRGLGRGQSLELAKAGADVVCAARTVEEITETAAMVRALGRRALVVQTDVIDSAQMERLVGATLAEFGKVDILVNNAGGGGMQGKPQHEITDDEWRYVIDLNLSSVYYGARAVYPHMAKQGKGKIINVASASGMRGDRRNVAYAASKAGVINLTSALAVAWARDGINVNCISPGPFPTERWQVTPEPAPGSGRARTLPSARFSPMQRGGRMEEMGYLCVLLASNASDYINGQNVLIDGGAMVGGYAPTGYTLDSYLAE
ncbi:MAG: SDR family oxidoreductase [Dehalococcoidia bacterium]|nr:SDR family oxidoreductase [Dehalococcoidia bacterium]